MRKVLSLVLALALCAFPKVALADSPCQAPALATTAVNISTITTTLIVTGSTTLTTYVCNIFGTFSETTAGTMALEYGQGATCGTGTVTLSGPIPLPSSTSAFTFNAAGVLYRIPVSNPANNVCVVTAGTTVSVVGSVTYLNAQ